MVLRLCRWLVPAAVAAACGVMLAVWSHDGDVAVSRPPASPARVAVPEHPPPLPLPLPAQAEPEPEPEPVASGRAGAAAAPPPGQLERLYGNLTRQAEQDAAGALAALLALDHRQRAYLAEDVIRRAAERAPEQTVRWLDAYVADPAERERLLMAAYAGIARHDPQFAFNEAQTLNDPDMRRLAAQQVLEVWAEEDVVAAYEWVRAQNGEGTDEQHVTVMQAYMEQLPQQAGQLIAGLPEGPTRSRLMDRYAFELARSDVAAAVSWVSQFPQEADTQRALSSVIDQWARQDPWAAIDYAALNVDGELGSALVEQVVTEMGLKQPDRLARSLDRLPQAYRSLAAHRLARTWASFAPGRAQRWVEDLPAGEVRDQARRGLAEIGGRG